MATTLSLPARAAASRVLFVVLWLLFGVLLVFLVAFLFVPLLAVFVEAFRGGLQAYWAALKEPDALAAIELTVLVAAIAVPLNVVFGLVVAWVFVLFVFCGLCL